MYNAPRRKLQPMPELPEAELSSDLDWMLRNPEFSTSQVVEAVVQECYKPLTLFAWAVLDDRQAAESAVEVAILEVLSRRERLSGEHTVKVLLYKALYQVCKVKLLRGKVRGILARPWAKSGRDGIAGEGGDDPTGAPAIWRCLRDLDEEDTLPTYLHEVHDLTASEIASVLNAMSENVIHCLERGQAGLSACFEDEASADRPIQDQIRDELGGLWPVDDLTQAQLAYISSKIESRLLKRGARARLSIYSQHLALAGLVTLLVLGIGWMANRLAPSILEPPAIETVIVTKIVQVAAPTRAFPTPAPAITPVPLSTQASESAVRQRMLESNRYWNSLWVDALLIQHGPKGYVGAPLIRHEQVWIRQPQYSLVLSAWANRDVDHVWFSANGKVYDVDLITGRPRLYDYHDDRLPVYSALESFISPTQIAKEAHRLEVAGEDQVAGRDTLILDWYSEDNKRTGRLWVDRGTGIVLRWRQFQNGSNVVTLEVKVTSILFDAEFSRDTFDRGKPAINFASDELDNPQARRTALTSTLVDSPPGHRGLDKVPPPEGFDLSQSRLVFQWNQTPRSGYIQPYLDDNRLPDDYGEEIPVDVFADGYYLGQIRLNPWGAICDRSADGQSIAYITRSGERNEGLSSLRWVNLMDLRTVSTPHPDARPGWDIAFAPDNSQLAYHGCIGDQCGVYVLDLLTGENERVFLQPGEYLTWNPEGDQLAWIGYLTSRTVPGVFVRDLRSGAVSYYGDVDAQSGELPEGSPFTAWGGNFPDRTYGMEGCVEPRPGAGPPQANIGPRSN